MPHASPIRRAALSWLARRDYSADEIAQKLLKKAYPLEEINTLLSDLTQEGWLNESRFTENYIYSRSKRGYGPKRIAIELKVRGIADAMIAELLDMTDNKWFMAARTVWQKHFKGQQPINVKIKAKQVHFLQRRGFTGEQINSLFREKVSRDTLAD